MGKNRAARWHYVCIYRLADTGSSDGAPRRLTNPESRDTLSQQTIWSLSPEVSLCLPSLTSFPPLCYGRNCPEAAMNPEAVIHGWMTQAYWHRRGRFTRYCEGGYGLNLRARQSPHTSAGWQGAPDSAPVFHNVCISRFSTWAAGAVAARRTGIVIITRET